MDDWLAGRRKQIYQCMMMMDKEGVCLNFEFFFSKSAFYGDEWEGSGGKCGEKKWKLYPTRRNVMSPCLCQTEIWGIWM